jgi:glycosyltransferase involved in cell wall biosynthesis
VLVLSAGLQRRGWRVEVATTPQSIVRPALVDAGIRVHDMPFSSARDHLAAARRLRALDRQRRYAVVHAHSSKAGAVARAALPDRGRLVYTPHCFAFNTDVAPPLRLLYRAVEQALVLRSGAIVTVCEWERAGTARDLRGVGKRLHMIENGVASCPPAEVDTELIAFKREAPLAGFIGRLEPPKDPLTMVRAAHVLSRRGLPSGRLAIVGNGSLGPAVEAEIARLDVGDRVRMFAFRRPVGRYLRAFDAFVLPSRWEALPVSALEAMSCGLPVVASPVGGVPDIVEDGRTGSLVVGDDPERLADALADLFADGARRRAMGDAARAVVARRYGVDRMVEQTAALYQQLLAGTA